MISVHPVGTIRNDLPVPPLKAGSSGLLINEDCKDAREKMREETRVSEVIISKEYADLLDGIEEYSHIMILYWGHQVPPEGRNLSRIHPAGQTSYPVKGIYATYSPARPNPILVTVARLVSRSGCSLFVTGLDAIDQSPILDIKPYVPRLYPRDGVAIPDWMEQIMNEFEA